jgi:hypothetical protein
MKDTRRVRTGILICLLVGAIGCSGSDEPAVSKNTSESSKVVRQARMTPDDLRANSVIEVTFAKATKPEWFSYVWYRNGEPIPGETTHRLEPHNFVRGDRISVDVVSESGEHFQTPEKQIINTPPSITHASALVQGEGGEAQIVAQVSARDVDNDDVQYAYRWYRNSTPIQGVSGPSLSMTEIDRGDVVYAEVIASDNMSQSPTYRTDALTIENHPPKIVSEPGAPNGNNFVYQVQVEDPDHDVLSYELLTAPSGMTIDDNGRVQWQMPTGDERTGSHKVTVQVSDSRGGLATQSFSITF